MLALLTVSASDVLVLAPPTPFFHVFFVCLILLLFHLFSGGRDAYVTARGALNVTKSATRQENVLPPCDIARNQWFLKTTDRLSHMPGLSKRLFET